MADQANTAINTYKGRVIDFADPDPAEIHIGDIAWGLSRICRFGAQSLDFYSVAQHAATVSMTVERMGHPELALAALHHDSHEAYSCDIPSPLKRLLDPTYREITDRLDRAIGSALGVELPDSGSQQGRLIKAADKAAFVTEASELLPGWTGVAGDEIDSKALTVTREVVETPIAFRPFATSQAEFRERHEQLLRSPP